MTSRQAAFPRPLDARIGPEERANILEATAVAVRVCTICRLHRTRIQAVPGEGPIDAPIFVIGEAPGRDEDARGRPFVGAGGKILDKIMRAAGLRRDEAYISNVVKCRPPENRAPKADEITSCRPYLLAQIDSVRPKIIITLGATALRGLLDPSSRFKESRGKIIEFGGVPLLPTYHPAAVLYNRRLENQIRRDFGKAARLLTTGRATIQFGRRAKAEGSPKVTAGRRGPSRAAKRSARRPP